MKTNKWRKLGEKKQFEKNIWRRISKKIVEKN